MSDSGTEYIDAESDWQPTLDLADQECTDRLEAAAKKVKDDLKNDNKLVAGETTHSPKIESKDDDTNFKVAREHEIEWIKDKESAPSSKPDRYICRKLENIDRRLVDVAQRLIGTELPIAPGYLGTCVQINGISNLKVATKWLRVDQNPIEEGAIQFEQTEDLRPNCTSSEQTESFTLLLKTFNSFTVSHEIVYTSSLTVKMDAKATIGQALSLGMGFDLSEELQITNSQEQTFSETKEITSEFDRVVKPMTELLVVFKAFKKPLKYSFDSKIVVDGDITVMNMAGPHPKPFTFALSNILSVEERTFLNRGIIESGTFRRTETRYYSAKFKIARGLNDQTRIAIAPEHANKKTLHPTAGNSSSLNS